MAGLSLSISSVGNPKACYKSFIQDPGLDELDAFSTERGATAPLVPSQVMPNPPETLYPYTIIHPVSYTCIID